VDPEGQPEQRRDIAEADRQQEIGREHQPPSRSTPGSTSRATPPSSGSAVPPGRAPPTSSSRRREASTAAPTTNPAQTPKRQTAINGMPPTVASMRKTPATGGRNSAAPISGRMAARSRALPWRSSRSARCISLPREVPDGGDKLVVRKGLGDEEVGAAVDGGLPVGALALGG